GRDHKMEPIIRWTDAARQPGRKKIAKLLRGCAAALLITGSLSPTARAQTDQPPIPSSVSGTVSYTDKSALPAGAAVHVQLVDVTQHTAPVSVVGQQVIANPGQVPIAYAIHFDPAGIDPTHMYAVQADISADGEIIYASTTPNPVLTMGKPAMADILLAPVTGSRPGVVTGTVAYMQRVALPSSAVVRVRLVDISM